MENIDNLKSSFKDLTKYFNSAFVLLLITSFYMIQRSYLSFPLAEDITSEFVDKTILNHQQPQVSASGLSFTYSSMNIFWPLVIFIIYAFLHLLLQKQEKIWEILNTQMGINTLLFDSLNLYSESQGKPLSRKLMTLACYIPLFAIIMHGISGYWIFHILTNEQIASAESQDILIWQACLQIFSTILSLLLSISIPFHLLKKLKSYKIALNDNSESL